MVELMAIGAIETELSIAATSLSHLSRVAQPERGEKQIRTRGD